MANKKSGSDSGGRPRKKKRAKPKNKKRTVRGAVRQWGTPAEFRIEIPAERFTGGGGGGDDVERSTHDRDGARTEPDEVPLAESRQAQYRALSDVAVSLWYLKTKHFGQMWSDPDPDVEDPRERRALGRLAKGVAALANLGIEVHDPINSRYPEGGEAMMKPIQLEPTPGISVALVTETVRPIVYIRDRLLQRGEVFVATPIADDARAARQDRISTPPPAHEED
jgi:hypothetical protein